MPEPISSSAATSTLSALALLSLFPGVDPGVLLGAFAGALVFIATTAELGNLRERLLAAGLEVGELACSQGMPPQGPKTSLEQRWVDETA